MESQGNANAPHAEALRDLALRKGVTVSELRRRARVSPQALARINRGEEVRPTVWAKLLRAAKDLPDLPYADEVLAG